MKNHQKVSLKPFLTSENHYLAHFLDIFFPLIYIGKVQFPSYPAALKSEYLELGINLNIP